MKPEGKRIWEINMEYCPSTTTGRLAIALHKALNRIKIKHSIRVYKWRIVIDVYSFRDTKIVLKALDILNTIKMVDIDEINAEIITIF